MHCTHHGVGLGVCRDFIVTGKETSTSASRGGHTTGTAQDEGELELREAGVQQEDTVLAEAATPGDRLARLSGRTMLAMAVKLSSDKARGPLPEDGDLPGDACLGIAEYVMIASEDPLSPRPS